MIRIKKIMMLVGVASFLGSVAAAQDNPDRVSVPLGDPARPATIKVGLINGSITVKGYEGKEVIVEARSRGASSRRSSRDSGGPGMHRLENTASALNVEEEGNVVSVGTGSFNRTIDLTIQTPVNSSVKLHATNDGDIKVEHIRGEIEVNNTNGHVTLTNVSGSVVANATNGNIIVTFDDVAQGKAMSFTSMNGKVDVTLPATTKARLVMRTDMGEIFTDFDVQMDPTGSKAVVDDARGKGGKYRVRMERGMSGTINGGGPEYQFKNFNGNIYIRKK